MLMRDGGRQRVRTSYRLDIQGLRAIAVTGVVLNHAGLAAIAGGFAGVDVFFVISGFLITGQLLGRLQRTGRIGFADFYARRIRRLLPAALAVLLATAAASAFLLPRTLLPQSLRDAAAAAAYVPNLMLAARGTDYLADTTPSLYQHFWSLGVEEQFYLVWPAAIAATVWLVARRVTAVRARRLALVLVLLAIAVASFLACVHETDASQPWAFFPVWTRSWQFALGGIAAVCAPAAVRLVPGAVRAAAGWAGLAGILLAYLVFDANTVYPGAAALLPTLAACALIVCGDTMAGPGLLLRRRPLQFVGAISYSLYLVHWPLLQLVRAHDPYDRPLSVPLALALMALAVPLAWLLYRFVEMPLRYRQPHPPHAPRLADASAHHHRHVRSRALRALLAGGMASVVVAGVALGGASVAAAAPLHSNRVAVDRPLTAPPRATGYVPADMHPTLMGAPDDNPPMYADGCELGFLVSTPHPCTFGPAGAPRVVLFGDSHAAEWQPALARLADRDGFQLVVQTKSSCRSVLEQQPGHAARDLACASWRTAVLGQLSADPPAAIILANYDGAHTGHGSEAADAWSSGLRHTIAALPSSSRVVVLADTPDLGRSANVCLSGHLNDTAACATSARVALDSSGRAAVRGAVTTTRASYLDLTRYFCSTTCPLVIGRTLVYRDANHLTATFAAQLAEPLGAALRPVLASILTRGSSR